MTNVLSFFGHGVFLCVVACCIFFLLFLGGFLEVSHDSSFVCHVLWMKHHIFLELGVGSFCGHFEQSRRHGMVRVVVLA